MGTCFASFPSSNKVDRLLLVVLSVLVTRRATSVLLESNISESKLCIEFSAGEKYRRKVIGIRAVWNIYGINGCNRRIFSGSSSRNLDVKITVGYHAHILPHAKRRAHTCTWAGACLAQRIA